MAESTLYRWVIAGCVLASLLGAGAMVASLVEGAGSVRVICIAGLTVLLPALVSIITRQLGQAGLMRSSLPDVVAAVDGHDAAHEEKARNGQ